MSLTDRSLLDSVNASHPRVTGPHFLGGPIDNCPLLLQQSYRLRYDVYCLERKFLPVEDYPTGLETDEFDSHSLHVGAVDRAGELAGTSRAVMASAMGLPIFDHCVPFPNETEFHRANPRLVEVGRLVVGRRYRRRRNEVVPGAEGVAASRRGTEYHGEDRRAVGSDALMTVLKALYEETRRVGATHWLTAMEQPLRSQLAEQGFPFRPFGPESDYYGPIVPYQMDLRVFESFILSGRFPGLDGFLASRSVVTARETG